MLWGRLDKIMAQNYPVDSPVSCSDERIALPLWSSSSCGDEASVTLSRGGSASSAGYSAEIAFCTDRVGFELDGLRHDFLGTIVEEVPGGFGSASDRVEPLVSKPASEPEDKLLDLTESSRCSCSKLTVRV